MTSYSKTATTIKLYDVPRSIAEDPRVAFLQSNLFWQVSCAKSKTKPVQKSAPGLYRVRNLYHILNQSTESTDGDGCIYACKSSNREIFSLIPFVQPAI